MSKNETLEFRDYVYELERKAAERPKIKALPEDKQKLFTYLCNIPAKEIRQAIKEWQ